MSDDRRVLHHVRRLFAASAGDGPADAELLRRFAHDRDEAAFELLVWRHAEMVLATCRQVLRDAHAAEDAFQATFLVLFRKAAAVRSAEALPGWLHRVACRVALRARGRGELVPMNLDALPASPTSARLNADLVQALHEEISRLPAHYRAAVVCCFLEGRTHDEAARVLGWPKGTVAGRLARAKDLLHRRLSSRGFAPAAALGVALSAASATLAARVGTLMMGLRAAAGEAAGLSPRVVLLAEGVMSMFGTKTKLAALALLGVALVGLGSAIGVGREKARPADGQAARPAVGEQPPAAAKADPLDEALKRAEIRRNLKQLAQAMHSFSDVNGWLPDAAITDKSGKPLLSWRVAILPFIGQPELYKQFKLNEPWDSAHNKKLLAKMPKVYAAVGARAAKHTTNYQLIVGPTALFTSHRRPVGGPGGGAPSDGGAGGPGGGAVMGESAPGTAGTAGAPGGMGPGAGMAGMAGPAMMGRPSARWHATVPDGLSNTLMIVEAGQAVPWTRPEDVTYDPKKPLPALGAAFPNSFHAAFADGDVQALPRRLDAKTLRALITIAGGEVVEARPMSGLSPARQAALQRLRERNEKLSDQAAALRDVLRELREEVVGLRWAAEDERLGQLDPELGELLKQNAALEKAIKEGTDEARKLLAELARLKKARK